MLAPPSGILRVQPALRGRLVFSRTLVGTCPVVVAFVPPTTATTNQKPRKMSSNWLVYLEFVEQVAWVFSKSGYDWKIIPASVSEYSNGGVYLVLFRPPLAW